MIIKSIHINAFGGIKNYHLKFIKGMNLIYGENEAGKSTIQNFVKIWLYGFSNYHGKNIIYNEELCNNNRFNIIDNMYNLLHKKKLHSTMSTAKK